MADFQSGGEATTDIVRESRNDSAVESIRQDRWARERDDRESLRAQIEKPVSDLKDAPKKKTPEGLDALDLRGLAERMYDDAHHNAAQEDAEKKEFDEFKRVGAHIKRTYGREPTEGIRELLRAEEMLRQSPDHALQFLHSQYGDGRYAEMIQQQTQTAAVQETAKFFNEHEISPEIERGIIQYLKSPDYKRTGDFEHDLTVAYRKVTQGRNRVGHF